MNDTDDVINYQYLEKQDSGNSRCVSCSQGVKTSTFLSSSTCISLWYWRTHSLWEQNTWIEEHYFERGVSFITSTEYTKVSCPRLLHGKFVRRIKGRGSDVFAKNRLWVMRFLPRFMVLQETLFFYPLAVVTLFSVESFMCVQVILYVEGRVRLLTMLHFTYCRKHMLAGIYLALYPKQTSNSWRVMCCSELLVTVTFLTCV
jgi:hypothetical protein